MEKCSTSPVKKEMQVKRTIKYNILTSSMKDKTLRIHTVGDRAVKLALLS